MKTQNVTTCIFSGVLFLLASCGMGDNKTTIKTDDGGKVTVNNLKDAGEKMEDAMKEAEKRKEERRKRGDTLALNYKVLQS